MTSNRDTPEWIATFDDVLLPQTAAGRFKNGVFDLIIDGESNRPRLKLQLDTSNPPRALPVAKVPTPPRKKSPSRH